MNIQADASVFRRTKKLLVYDKISAFNKHAKLGAWNEWKFVQEWLWSLSL